LSTFPIDVSTWKDFYPDAAELVGDNHPKPRGKPVVLSCFVDSDHEILPRMTKILPMMMTHQWTRSAMVLVRHKEAKAKESAKFLQLRSILVTTRMTMLLYQDLKRTSSHSPIARSTNEND